MSFSANKRIVECLPISVFEQILKADHGGYSYAGCKWTIECNLKHHCDDAQNELQNILGRYWDYVLQAYFGVYTQPGWEWNTKSNWKHCCERVCECAWERPESKFENILESRLEVHYSVQLGVD